MHNPPLAPSDGSRHLNVRGHSAESGFSLVEVSLAIGIVAFAFVALFGLLPVGMTIFRQSIDTSNETWIMQGFNSMVQVTDWRRVKELSFEKSDEIYYFDEEGRPIDTKKRPVASREQDRIYAAKLIVEAVNRPTDSTAADPMVYGYRVLAVLAPVLNTTAMQEFNSVTDADRLRDLPKATAVKTRSFMVSRMDSEKDT